MDITIEQLRRRHPEAERWVTVWPNYRLAYIGGDEFLAAAGQQVDYWRSGTTPASGSSNAIFARLDKKTPPRRFLRQFEGEPNDVYDAIWQRAEYLNYLNPAIQYFLTYLFATPPIIRPREGTELPNWWEPFFRNADDNGHGLLEMGKNLLGEALIGKRAGWLIGRPDSVGEQDDDDESLTLVPYRAEDIYDWQKSPCGELEWVVLHKNETRREFPGDRVTVETFTYLDQQSWQSWEIIRANGPDGVKESIESIGDGEHGLGRVPFVMIELRPELWLTDKMYSWQIGLFNQWTRLKNAMTLGCVLQPYVMSNDATAASRIIGEGVLLRLRAGSEVDKPEDFGWKHPDISPLDFIWKFYKEAVAEGYRIMHQMGNAIDAKSVASIARSGASKFEDRKSTEVILRGFGQVMADALVQICDVVSLIYGDNASWTVDGFDNFNIAEPMDELTFLNLGATSGIDSPTFEKRLKQKIARLVLDKEDESTRDTIDKEIEESIDAKAEQQDAQAEMIKQGMVGAPQDPAAGDMKPGDMTGDHAAMMAAQDKPGANPFAKKTAAPT